MKSIDDPKKKIMPVCIPRAQTELRHTTECAVVILEDRIKNDTHWESPGQKMGTDICKKNGVFIKEAISRLLCIGTKVINNFPCGTLFSPLTLICKYNDMWSVYGIGSSCVKSKDRKWSYGYFLSIPLYRKWISKKTGVQLIKD